MKYALLMYANPAHTKAMSDAAVDAVLRKHAALRDELTDSGELAGGAGLALPEETTVLRLGAEGAASAKGPLASEPAEHLTAYYEVECASEERAAEIAARTLDDHVTGVEVRRIHDTT